MTYDYREAGVLAGRYYYDARNLGAHDGAAVDEAATRILTPVARLRLLNRSYCTPPCEAVEKRRSSTVATRPAASAVACAKSVSCSRARSLGRKSPSAVYAPSPRSPAGAGPAAAPPSRRTARRTCREEYRVESIAVQYCTVLYSTVQYCSDRFWFIPVPVHTGSGSYGLRFPVQVPVHGLPAYNDI